MVTIYTMYTTHQWLLHVHTSCDMYIIAQSITIIESGYHSAYVSIIIIIIIIIILEAKLS